MPFPCPTDPTPDEVIDVLGVSAGRISIAWDALQRILLEVIAPLIARANQRLSLRLPDGTLEPLRLPIPRRCYLQPEKISDATPVWIISTPSGLSLETFTPQQVRMRGNTVVGLAYNSMLSAADVKDAHDILDLLVEALGFYRTGHLDGAGLQAWSAIVAHDRAPFSSLPGWENKRGLAQSFEISQFPNENRWDVQP
jgi:hypothetical protein